MREVLVAMLVDAPSDDVAEALVTAGLRKTEWVDEVKHAQIVEVGLAEEVEETEG